MTGWIGLPVLLAAAGPAVAAPNAPTTAPYLVKQINPAFQPGSSTPQEFLSLGGYAVFNADDGVYGEQPWRTDGTVGGTRRLSRCPDCLGPIFPFGLAPGALLFFAQASGGPPGQSAVWVTHGTAPSTRQLLAPYVDCGLLFSWLSEAQGLDYFALGAADGNCHLWRSDGSAAGTLELASFPLSTFPTSFADYGGRVFFGANDGSGSALWVTDGTARGTKVVVRLAGAPSDIQGPSWLNVAGSELIFAAYTTARGFELWRTNGTAAGTQPLAELVRGAFSPTFYDFMPLGQRLLFVADDGHGQNLWSVSGASPAAQQLTHFKSHMAFGFDSFTFPRATINGKTFFSADDGVHGSELWASDGTAGGTHLVSDVCPGKCPGFGVPEAILGGRLLFDADDGKHGYELWSTDGTAKGTRMVADLCPGACDAEPAVLAVIGKLAVLLATGDSPDDVQLWSTDGTAAGTQRLTSFAAAQNPLVDPESELWAAVPGGLVFTGADAAHGAELWVTNGLPAGTHLLADLDTQRIYDGSFPADLQAAGDKVFFYATDGSGATGQGDGDGPLWVSDGSSAGTHAVGGPAQGLGASFPQTLPSVELGNSLVFIAPDNNQQPAVWRSDGSAGDIERLTPSGVSAGLEITGVTGGLVFFVARPPSGPFGLWKSDGTPGGTGPVGGVAANAGSDGSGAFHLTPWNGRLFYYLGTETGDELWTSDGTPAGTARVATLNGSFDDEAQPVLQPFGNRLYFFAEAIYPLTDAWHLWSTDGTAAGTSEAISFGLPPDQGVFPSGLAVAGDQLFIFTQQGLWAGDGTASGTHLVSDSLQISTYPFFSATWAALGSRLAFISATLDPTQPGVWLTDGTAAGTVPLTDATGGFIPTPDQLLSTGSRLLISSPAPGGEVAGTLWWSDGTPPGTLPIFNMLGGTQGGELALAGGLVFFQGFDPASGNQLWAARP